MRQLLEELYWRNLRASAKGMSRSSYALLGGMVVKIGARLYDTSLKSRLQRLQYAMKGAA